MTKEYTRYFAELKSKDKEQPNWFPHNTHGEDSIEEAREELTFLKRSFSKNFTFRIVRRDYTYKETVLE